MGEDEGEAGKVVDLMDLVDVVDVVDEKAKVDTVQDVPSNAINHK